MFYSHSDSLQNIPLNSKEIEHFKIQVFIHEIYAVTLQLVNNNKKNLFFYVSLSHIFKSCNSEKSLDLDILY